MGNSSNRAVDQPLHGHDALQPRPRGERAPQHDRARLPGRATVSSTGSPGRAAAVRGQERRGRGRQRQAVDGHDEIAGTRARLARPAPPAATGLDAHPSSARPVLDGEPQLDGRLEQLVARKAELRAEGLGAGVAVVQPKGGVGQADGGEREGQSPGEGTKQSPPEQGLGHGLPPPDYGSVTPSSPRLDHAQRLSAGLQSVYARLPTKRKYCHSPTERIASW